MACKYIYNNQSYTQEELEEILASPVVSEDFIKP